MKPPLLGLLLIVLWPATLAISADSKLPFPPGTIVVCGADPTFTKMTIEACMELTKRVKQEHSTPAATNSLPICGMTGQVDCRMDQRYICGTVTGADCSILMNQFAQHFRTCVSYRGYAVNAFNFKRNHMSALFATNSLTLPGDSERTAKLIADLVDAAYSGQWENVDQFAADAFKNCLDGHPF